LKRLEREIETHFSTMSEAVVERRARREAVKKVNYAKEQEFSEADDNIFEDSADEEPVVQRKSRGRPRKSSGKSAAATAAVVAPTTTISGPDMEELDDDHGEYGAYKPVFSEKGYDPSMLPIRERFHFLPEYEEDGSPKIDLIVGRRPVDEKEELLDEDATSSTPGENGDDDEEEEEEEKEDAAADGTPVRGGRRTRKGSALKATPPTTTPKNAKKKGSSPSKNEAALGGPVDYEYLVKYKGRSYLHLIWNSGADLESMNKSAKGIYRRYLKKVIAGVEEDIESPEFDPAYILPEKIVDEADQEITVELTDKELLRWEKQREKEMAEEDDDDAAMKKKEAAEKKEEDEKSAESKSEEKKEEKAGEYY
jgi:hypothetical protein